MAIYKTTEYQTLSDLCIIIYGSLDYIAKLSFDNNLNFNDYIPAGVDIIYDGFFTPNPKRITTGQQLYIQDPIQILTQPVGDTVCYTSGTTTITVDVNVTGVSFRWQRSALPTGGFINISDGSDYSGTTTNTLVITDASFYNPLTGLNSYYYRCLINGSIASNSALVEIYTPPSSISLTEPTYPLTIHDTATFSAALDIYAGVTYQWYWTIDGGISWNGPIDNYLTIGSTYFTGCDTKDLILNDIAYSLNDVQFRCNANQMCGVLTIDSGPISVDPPSYIPPVTSGLLMLQMAVDATSFGPPYNNHVNPWSDRLNFIIGSASSYPGLENSGLISGGNGIVVDNSDPTSINYVQSILYTTQYITGSTFSLHDERYSDTFGNQLYGSLTQSITIMGVAKLNEPPNSSNSWNSSGKATITQIGFGTSGKAHLYFNSSGDLWWDTKGNVGPSQIFNNTVLMDPFIFTAEAQRNILGDNIELYINGLTAGNGPKVTSPNISNFTYSTWQPNVGNQIPGGYLLNGQVGAIIYYNRILTDTERGQMETWLNDYYSIF